jgi:hypothetical protein
MHTNDAELISKVKDDMELKWRKNVTWVKSKFGESGFNDLIIKGLKPELKDKPVDIISARIMLDMIKETSK